MDIPWLFAFLYEHSHLIAGLVMGLVGMTVRNSGDPFDGLDDDEKEQRLRDTLDLIDRFQTRIVNEFREQLLSLGFDVGRYTLSDGSLRTTRQIAYALGGLARMLLDISELLKQMPDVTINEAGDDG